MKTLTQSHYYQPLWTLVGGGIRTLEDSRKDMASVIPLNAEWIKDKVTEFNPTQNSLKTSDGTEVFLNQKSLRMYNARFCRFLMIIWYWQPDCNSALTK